MTLFNQALRVLISDGKFQERIIFQERSWERKDGSHSFPSCFWTPVFGGPHPGAGATTLISGNPYEQRS